MPAVSNPAAARWNLVMRAVLLITALFVLGTPVAAADPAPGIPPDGPAGPTHSLGDLQNWVAIGSPVTTQQVTVSSVSCPNCSDATTPADFTVTDSAHVTMRVHVQNTFQATYNVKKQLLVPAVGSQVVVQGRLESGSSGRYIAVKRFGESGHAGPHVFAYDVAAGIYPTGTYVWLNPVRILNVGHWDDGDYSFDVRDPTGGGLVHVELAPPFNGQLRVPNMGDTVQPYGAVRYDPDHGWWEIHPVRCWGPTECASITASYLQNGPPAGTPASPGLYAQGSAQPLWVPRTGGGSGGNFTATFTIHSPSQWWQQVSVHPSTPRTIAGMQVRSSGGAWQTMKHASWGDWTSSIHTPAGTKVEFLAMDSSGNSAQSAPFTWLDGTMSQGSSGRSVSPPPSPPSPSSGNLTATFAPSPDGNEWWIQVTVKASQPVRGVEVAVNSGSWVQLDASSWGDWVKSLHAPQGSQVVFRATAADGSSKTSPSLPWPPGPTPKVVDPPPVVAQFTPSLASNESWVQVTVMANQPIRQAWAQINYGAWMPLTKLADGDWAAHLSAPGGSKVVFRLDALTSEKAYSYVYAWTPQGD